MNSDDKAPTRADREVDALYHTMRKRHNDARANGYRLQTWFTNERAIVLHEVGQTTGPVLDVGCGSGLMVQALVGGPRPLYGVDFNADACSQARHNEIAVVRGDAFNLPFADQSIGCLLNCQFLNQQTTGNAVRLIAEIARVLLPQGRAIVVWRNGTALIHRAARILYRLIDFFTGRPEFPYINHSVASLRDAAHTHGLSVLSAGVLFPPLRWRINDESCLRARLLGASGILVLTRTDDQSG